MTAHNFRELTTTLAHTTSRRRAIRVIFTGTLAGLGGLLGLNHLETARADACLGPTKHCNHDNECCSKHCFYDGHANTTICA
ncbi:hypothetical protein [Dictyobacter alpinus]|uniref:hypothetical protein n=1 Tax=Dictyobacter alpinus TaxID=2014873 RepID=UPI000F820BFA|nr:hypothetical protein [Dictyobacter alpinus]